MNNIREFFVPTEGPANCIIDSRLEPIAHVKPGEIVKIHTADFAGGALHSPEQKPREAVAEANIQYNPQMGPFYIEGAEPGDALVVEILDIQPDNSFGINVLIENSGVLVPTGLTRMLTEPLEERTSIYDFEGEGEDRICKRRDGNPKMVWPYRPFYGTISTADDLQAISSLVPTQNGGNMDAPGTAAPGNKVILPVKVPGACFFVGDAHAIQGDGELNCAAIEFAAVGTFRFSLKKNYRVNWPRVENEEYIMTVGATRPLDDCVRIAYCELIDWMVQDYGWDRLDAYEALSFVGECSLGEMVNPQFTMVAKVKKKYL
ncbi:MAG: acetamidase/formamidase family protein [Clostridium sp.]|nr:acetamidase/formamidase family protein [Clostridium sp.]